MAYRLKKVRFQQFDRRILLQNENGPCPLLAAANLLLLKGAIHLPSESIRAGAASIDDVVNVLAEYALRVKGDQAFHLNEMLTLFPTLQYGMDVNPKFTAGPTGVEYTSNLTAFEMLGVELVHGWLIDPQDAETAHVIGNKTYNQLIELVIKGNDTDTRLEELTKQISVIETRLNESNDEEWVKVPKTVAPRSDDEEKKTEDDTAEDNDASNEEDGEDEKPPAQSLSEEDGQEVATDSDTSPDHLISMERKKCEEHLAELRKKVEEVSENVTTAAIINNFLQATSHQLSQYGLSELYAHMPEGGLSVFFRNNHFATITKHKGVLYLLVTDLGYANVSDIMWEKLDVIDGDTEYVNQSFAKPPPQSQLLPSRPVLSPEQLLASRGQSEADFQLALQLSKETTAGVLPSNAEDESKLMAAATEASLREFNGMDSTPATASATFAKLPTVTEPSGAEKPEGPPTPCSAQPTQQSADLLMAMQIQAEERPAPTGEDVSLALAQQLQAEEDIRARRERQRQQEEAARRKKEEAGKAQCVIS